MFLLCSLSDKSPLRRLCWASVSCGFQGSGFMRKRDKMKSKKGLNKQGNWHTRMRMVLPLLLPGFQCELQVCVKH